MYWLEISVVCDGEAAEAVAEVLGPFAHSHGVVLEQQADPDALEEDALEPDVTVKIYVPQEKDTSHFRQRIRETLYHLNRLYPISEPRFHKLEDKDWAEAWKEHYRPFRIGQRFLIQPSWLQIDEEMLAEGDIVLTLDPGMAFGTGLHPTTQMCLQGMEELVQTGTRVLDVGTGSGILAIAAARLGASRILGVDTDPLAVKTARENAEQNDVLAVVELHTGTLETVGEHKWDLIIVNILAPVIVSMLNDGLMDYLAPNGRLLLSGIIDQQLADVEQAVHSANGAIERVLTVRDWVAAVVRQEPRGKNSAH